MSENPFTDGQQFSAARLNSMYNAHQNEGVLNGLDASTSVNAFDVDVASGELFLNDDVVNVGSATLSLSTSDPEDRIDLISADSTGLTVTQGNPAATSGQPIAPDIPSGDVLVSLIYVRGGSSEILTGDIFNDYKVTLKSISPALIDQTLPGSLDHTFLSGITRDDHHTPVIFEFNPHPSFFGGNSISKNELDDGSRGTQIVTASNQNANFTNELQYDITVSVSPNEEGDSVSITLERVELFNSKSGNYETVDNIGISDNIQDNETLNVSNTVTFAKKFATNARLIVDITGLSFATGYQVSFNTDAKVQAAVFE